MKLKDGREAVVVAIGRPIGKEPGFGEEVADLTIQARVYVDSDDVLGKVVQREDLPEEWDNIEERAVAALFGD